MIAGLRLKLVWVSLPTHKRSEHVSFLIGLLLGKIISAERTGLSFFQAIDNVSTQS